MALVVMASVPQVALETVQPMLLMVLIDAIVGRDMRRVWAAVAGLVALIPIYVSGNFLFEYGAARVGAAVSNDLRIAAFWRLQSLPVSFHRGRARGDLLSRFSSDLDAVERAMATEFPFAFSCVLSIAVGVVLLFTVEWRLAIGLCALLPLVVIGPRWLGERAAAASYQRQRDAASVMSSLEESIAAHSVIKAFDLQGVLIADFGRRLSVLLRSTGRASLFSGLQGTSMSGSGSILLILAIAGGAMLAVRGQLSVGGLVAIFDLLWFIVANLHALSKVVTPLQRASSGMLRIQEVLDAPDEVRDAPGAASLAPFSQQIELRGVGVRYGDAPPALVDVDCTIRAGESVLVVGPSGSGKSTLLGLLLRLRDPATGTIAIDGHELRQVTSASLRMQMGVVFQDSFLFDATLRENIRYGMPEASDADVEDAAREAGIHDFIASLPEGYDTRAGGGGGSSLSGGERQRVALARALVRRPAILLLDEPASALDAQAEAAMNRTLQQIARGRTVISVTHRLTAAVPARILVFHGGRLVEEGRHDELVARGGVYARLWAAQNQSVSRSDADFTMDPINSL
ncbi:MAG TPA: ABC transporter ATP-binding protein [Vicinamibacterales bacterium]|nr:ABC transporter ATP-binding protein [Vicinamibacterales bacterium]